VALPPLACRSTRRTTFSPAATTASSTSNSLWLRLVFRSARPHSAVFECPISSPCGPIKSLDSLPDTSDAASTVCRLMQDLTEKQFFCNRFCLNQPCNTTFAAKVRFPCCFNSQRIHSLCFSSKTSCPHVASTATNQFRTRAERHLSAQIPEPHRDGGLWRGHPVNPSQPHFLTHLLFCCVQFHPAGSCGVLQRAE
jgi:hypothetical protein